MSATLAKQTEDRQKKDLVTWFAVRDCDGWVTAVQATSLVAAAVRERLGVEWPWSYRPVAFALRRLVRAGLVEERVELRKTPHKYRDTVREYRPRIDGYSPGELWPPVFPVPDSAPRRAVRME